MAKKTIEDFRAEQSLWRGELANRLNMTEAELKKIEEKDEVPEEIGEKIVDLYSLPEDYFTFDPEASEHKRTPKYPFLYLYVVCIVWLFLFDLLERIVSLPVDIAVFMGMDNTEMLSLISTACTAVITSFSGIYLSSFIIRRTSFTTKIRKYDYLYPCLCTYSVYFINPLIYFLTQKIEQGYLSNLSAIILPLALTFFSSVLKALFTAFFLYSVIVIRDTQQNAAFALVGCIPTMSFIMYFIANVLMRELELSYIIFLSVQLVVLVMITLVLTVFREAKGSTFFLTAAPIAIMLVPPIYNMLTALLGIKF